jgi:hypothetical protein
MWFLDITMQSIQTLRAHGNAMAESAREFANDPLCGQRRQAMIAASKELLDCVARFLSLADMIDVNLLLRAVQLVQQDLGKVELQSGAF